MKNKLGVVLALIFVLLLAACATQPAATQTATEIPTEVATTQVVNTQTVIPTEEATFTPTSVPTATSLPTATATLELTATIESTLLPTTNNVVTSSDISLTLNANTVCRKGPATNYHSVVTIPAGIKVKAVGRLANSTSYYLVENPTIAGEYCWVYSEGATLEGNRALLPISEPLPSPTADSGMNFTVVYSKIKRCYYNEDYAFSLVVTNTSDLVWKSIRVAITDTSNSNTATYISDRFEELTSDCVIDNYRDVLTKGQHVYVTPWNPGHFDYSPYGKTFWVKVTLCSEDVLQGTCMTKQIKVTP
jgi:hypothetical protein